MSLVRPSARVGFHCSAQLLYLAQSWILLIDAACATATGSRRAAVCTLLKIRHLFVYGLLLCIAAHAPVAFAEMASPGFSSPVRISATWEELANYSDDELAYVLPRVAHLAGTDNHGYEFPGNIARVLTLDPTASVSCSWDTMSVQPNGDRWTELNPYEEAFIHSADPASLRVAPTSDGGAVITFRIDGRALQYDPYDQPVSVDHYLVEWASTSDGPFNLLKDVVEDFGTWIHIVRDSDYQPNRYYRVRTVFADKTVHPYSCGCLFGLLSRCPLRLWDSPV